MDNYVVYVNGTNRNLYLPPEDVDFTRAVQDQSTLTVNLIDPTGAWRPVLNDKFVIVKDERTLTLSLTIGVTSFTVTSGSMTTDDVGRTFIIAGAGDAGAPLVARMVEYFSATAGRLEFAPSVIGNYSAKLGTWLFGGFIWDFGETPFYGDFGARYDITAQDFNAYPGRILINTYWLPGTTVKTALTTIANTLNFAFGTRLDPATLDGPALTELFFSPWRNGREVLDYMVGYAQWTWQITPDNVLRAFPPSTIVLPTLDNMVPLEGRATVTRTFDDYRNDQRIFFGGSGEGDFLQRFYGDGTTRVWDLLGLPIFAPEVPALPRPTDYTTKEVGGVAVTLIPYMNVFRGTTQTQENIGLMGSGEKWQYDPVPNTMHHLASEPVLTASDRVEFVYRTTFPLVAGAGNAAGVATYGFFSRSDTADHIKDEVIATQYAQKLIDTYGQVPATRLNFTTYDEHYTTLGARLPVNLPNRNLPTQNFTILSCNTHDDGAYNLLYTVEAVLGDGYRERGIDFWRQPNPAGPSPLSVPSTTDLSQAVVEVLVWNDATRFSHAVVEALILGPNAQFSQAVVEALIVGPDVQFSQAVVEVLIQ